MFARAGDQAAKVPVTRTSGGETRLGHQAIRIHLYSSHCFSGHWTLGRRRPTGDPASLALDDTRTIQFETFLLMILEDICFF